MSNPTLNTKRIQLGTLDNPGDIQRLTVHIQELYNGQIPVITGSGAPTTIPPKISAQFIDTKNNHIYVATGNTKVGNWVKVS